MYGSCNDAGLYLKLKDLETGYLRSPLIVDNAGRGFTKQDSAYALSNEGIQLRESL